MRVSSWFLTLLLCSSGAVPTRAASASALPEPGTRIRLTAKAPQEKRWIGPLISVANETVTMSDGDTTGALVAVPTRYVTRFEVSRGHHGNSLRFAVIGFVIGACVGTAIGYYSLRDTELNSIDIYAYHGLLGAGAGAVVGSAIGAVTRSEQWRALPPQDLRDTSKP
jgi:hypothetical protein